MLSASGIDSNRNFSELFESLNSFQPMPNYIYSILRIYGPEEERDMFMLRYVRLRVFAGRKNSTVAMADDPDDSHRQMLQWYEFHSWKNQLGTFISFATPVITLSFLDGYKLHKEYPNLKFVYRSIDEGWPDHCGRWEFDQNYPISDEKEKINETIDLLLRMFPMLMMTENIDGIYQKMVDILNENFQDDDPKREVMVKFFKESGINDEGIQEGMEDMIRYDRLFYLTKEEKVNCNCEVPCEQVHRSFFRRDNYLSNELSSYL